MNHKISWVERDPQSLRWDPRRCPPSPVFSCLCLNVLTPFARLWGSADPLLSQVSFLTSWILPQTFSAGLSSSLLGHIFHSQPVCSISPACLIWQLPDQGIPAALAGVAWLLLWCQSQNWSNPSPSAPQPVLLLPCRAHTAVCAATEQTGSGMGSADARDAPKSPTGLLAGQGTGSMEQLGHKAGWSSWRWHCWVCSHSSQQLSHLRAERPSAQVLDLKVGGVH